MNNIETLIAPVLMKICEYCTFKSNGYEIPEETLLSDLRNELGILEQKCATMPLLQQQYAAIYKPLVFFIDYTIKEGGFTYSSSYRELARSFNEFSGDDKFFDLLRDAVNRDEPQEVLRLFYLMMGLGFDGYYKRNRGDILEVMSSCRSHLRTLPDMSTEFITPEVQTKPRTGPIVRRVRVWKKSWFWVITMGVFLGVSIWLNGMALSASVKDFEQAVGTAALAAQPYNVSYNDREENDGDSPSQPKQDKDNGKDAGETQ